ncbi:MAG: protein-L-isoaspartate(D-aspartate) O-methyltransferase [Gammaproteobacteria bacterium]|nr:protein-L-isoaspartate(D-aspartate) O-methyltransferase [Gammaproteobacteria bacterium]
MKRADHRGIGMTSMRTRERLVSRLADEGIKNQTVLEAIRNTPRHIFVDEALASRAYEDTALPIGHSQTISQPYIVARMTEALLGTDDNNLPKKILEVGTGSGYQAAILARLVEQVYTTERIRALVLQARNRFYDLGLHNIKHQHSDGSWGWPEHAPYDGILVTASPKEIPQALMDQLKMGGRLVIPVGDRDEQQLLLVTRTAGGVEEKILDRVRFVSLQAGKL